MRESAGRRGDVTCPASVCSSPDGCPPSPSFTLLSCRVWHRDGHPKQALLRAARQGAAVLCMLRCACHAVLRCHRSGLGLPAACRAGLLMLPLSPAVLPPVLCPLYCTAPHICTAGPHLLQERQGRHAAGRGAGRGLRDRQAGGSPRQLCSTACICICCLLPAWPAAASPSIIHTPASPPAAAGWATR